MIAIAPDVHGRTFWHDIAKNIGGYDKVIFLGDYLDPYGYEGITNDDAISNFKEIIDFARQNKDKVVLLYGNHDLPYINEYFRTNACGGRMDKAHKKEIGELFNDNIDLFSLSYEPIVNGKRYLFSHSGVCMSWYKKHSNLIGELTSDNINSLISSDDGIRALCDIGISRWGNDYVGSIVWADVDDHKYSVERIDGIYQIFGHTQQRETPIITDSYACLDVRCAFSLDDEGNIKEIENEKVKADEE